MDLFSTTLSSNGGGANGYTYAILWNTAALTMPSFTIARMRVTFNAAAAEALTVTNAYIGHQASSGDAYDFAATPVQLLFATAANVAISAAGSATSDWASFAYDKTSKLIVAFYIGGGTSYDGFKYKTSVTDLTTYYKIANDAATVNKTGYSSAAAQINIISKLEVEDVAGGWFMFFG